MLPKYMTPIDKRIGSALLPCSIPIGFHADNRRGELRVLLLPEHRVRYAPSPKTDFRLPYNSPFFLKIKMRKSQHIWTYAFLLHDLPMKFSPILPFLARFRKKGAWLFLQLDLRRNATRCTPIIAEANRNFKRFFHIRCLFLPHIVLRRLLRWDAARQCLLDHVRLLRPPHQPIVFAP